MIRKESRKRSLAKTVSWRSIGTLNTVLLAWWVSGNPLAGIQIGAIDTFVKMLLFYIHERLWEYANRSWAWNIKMINKGKIRTIHLIKALTWRTFSSSLTFFLGWIIFTDIKEGFFLALLEFIFKIVLFYGHERIWDKIPYGLEKMPKGELQEE